MKNKYDNSQKINKIMIYILFAMLLFIPNILKLKIVNYISPILEPDTLRSGTYLNIFVQSKFSFLIFSSLVLVTIFIIYLMTTKKDIKYNIFDILIGVFTLFALIATFFSEYKYVALMGKYNRTDGALFFILLMVLLFIASKIRFSDIDLDILSYALFPFLIINAALAYLYQNEYNLLESNFFKKYILLGGDINIEAGSYLISTLENPNYLSGIAGFLSVFFITRFVFLGKINPIDFVGSILSVFLLVSSFSSSGIFAFVIALILILIFIDKTDLYTYLKLIIFIPAFYVFLDYFKDRDPRITQEITTLRNLLDNNIVYAVSILFILLIMIYFIKEFFNYSKFKYVLSGVIFAMFLVGLFVVPHSPYYEQSYPDKIYERDEIVSIINNKEIKTDFLSNRVFPWQNTFDLIKERPLTGYGFGTLAFELNHSNMFNPSSRWPSSTVFDKPHNSFLEVGYGAGIFALSAFLLIFVNLTFKSLEKFRDKFDPRNLAIFLGMIAFLVQGMVNDSNVGSYPVMFIFFGILISRVNNDEEIVEVENNVGKTTKHKRNKGNHSS